MNPGNWGGHPLRAGRAFKGVEFNRGNVRLRGGEISGIKRRGAVFMVLDPGRRVRGAVFMVLDPGHGVKSAVFMVLPGTGGRTWSGSECS